MQIGYETYEKMMILGDINLDANKWEENGFLLKSVSTHNSHKAQ